MFLFFDIFHDLNEFLEQYDAVIEAVDGTLSANEKQQLEQELCGIQQEFRQLWLAADANDPVAPAGVSVYLEKLLRHGDAFRRHAQRVHRFDLVYGIEDLQARIRAARDGHTVCTQPARQSSVLRDLIASLPRQPVFAPLLQPA